MPHANCSPKCATENSRCFCQWNGWAVYLCGCTDCFLHAFFTEKEHAMEWINAHLMNPEGYILKEMSVEDFAKQGFYQS